MLPSAERSPSWAIPPRIVAEALVAIADAPLAIGALARAEASAVARAIAKAAMPAEANVPSPEWLLPEQRRGFRRALKAIDGFGGALLAEPTGAGKTYIALAVAAAWSGKPPVCLVPAALADQWRRTAALLAVPIVLGTHERASRGSLPVAAGFAIIDESHRFRNPGTRRYTEVARWLVGQRGLLLTATPAVNRLADLAAQLRLVLRDDVLAPWGVGSLAGLGDAASVPEPVSAVMVTSGRSVPQPSRRYQRERPIDATPCLETIDALTLSSSPPVAALVRGVLLRALASSPAALAGVVRRYRLLLLHGSDAAASGVRVGRAALRGWIGPAAEQTVLWPLLGDEPGEMELDVGDAAAIEAVESRARDLLHVPDARVERLKHLLRDGRRTLIFTGWRDTARWLRDELGTSGVAWCTGSEAGIGRHRMARGEVLALFRPRMAAAPQVLIATDVASEGLDLQGAGRVVHFDLPWTPMRLAQRDGRAARLGNPLPEVEIVRFDPPEELDRRLRQTDILRIKGKLPARAGVSGTGLARWREIVNKTAAEPATSGIGCVEWDERPGILACVQIRAASPPCGISEVVWLESDGSVVRALEWLAHALETAVTGDGCSALRCGESRTVETRLASYLRDVLRRGASATWSRPGMQPDARKVARVLANLARRAARYRDAALMLRVDRALRFAAGGRTAGEELLMSELARLPGAALLDRLSEVPTPGTRAPLEAAIVGAILFRSTSPPLR